MRANRAQLPSLPEENIIGASYYNTLTSCFEYKHGDHLSVHKALFNTDQGVPGVQWGATCRFDPDVRRTGTITNAIYDANMTPKTNNPDGNPGATRSGHFQKMYGWLSFPSTHYFASGTDNSVLFSQSQAFWQRY